ncbi:preprotein translocase subunit SecG [Aliifodinibius sp. S!AR15-10]|uniref:preprotein translocase subunit SecG n=1 Tax=Aliifodinibius sp. S!AR15-10 TaxID=2950437 RepID=UPI0028545D8C|nr:preprotein translocase subunit SecG [Aliifodinibius sp. S!AR15-10]MDR8394334.1 preprotein translocase subunit SecG [Aliifodinibius sp. S!AR15-10]
MLYTLIISLIVIISVLLTIVVLLQPGQGQGLSGGGIAGGMAGGGGLGARRAADLLSKSTSVLAGALLVLSVLANFAIDNEGPTESAVQQSGVEQPVQDNMNNPSQSPSAVPQLPQDQGGSSQQGQGGGNSDAGSGSEDGGN